MNLIDTMILILFLLAVTFIVRRKITKRKSNKKSKCSGCSGCFAREFCTKDKE